MSKLFVNYRRRDAPSAAKFLYIELEKAFGRDRLFKDVDNLRPGQRFPLILAQALKASEVFLAVIGPQWVKIRNADGTRRLDEADDFVRMEIEQALALDKVVIPILVDGAVMPGKHEVPASLRPLTDIHAVSIAPDHFERDVARLVVDINAALTERDQARALERQRAAAEVEALRRAEAEEEERRYAEQERRQQAAEERRRAQEKERRRRAEAEALRRAEAEEEERRLAEQEEERRQAQVERRRPEQQQRRGVEEEHRQTEQEERGGAGKELPRPSRIRLGRTRDFLPLIFPVLVAVIALREMDFVELGLWIAILIFSIQFTQMASALVAQYYRLSPVVCGSFIHFERPDRSHHDALISAAGPTSSLLLAGLSFAADYFFGGQLMTEPLVSVVFRGFFWINIVLGLLNLMPLWPNVGGSLFRLGMALLFGGAIGEVITHIVGALTWLLAAWLAYPYLGVVGILLGAYWTWQNIQRTYLLLTPIYLDNRFARELGKKMRAAYEAGQYDEAYRLGRQVRSESNLDSGTLASVWEVLGVVAAVRDNYEEAWSYLKRAPERGRVLEARAACIIALELKPEAQAFIASGKLGRVPEHLQVELRALASLPRG